MRNYKYLSALHMARTSNGTLRRGMHFNTPTAEEAAAETETKTLEGILAKFDSAAKGMEARLKEIGELTTKSAGVDKEIQALKDAVASIPAMKSALRDRLGGDFPGLELEKEKFDIGKLMQFRKGIISHSEIGHEIDVLEQTHKKYSGVRGWAQTKDGIMSTLSGGDGGVGLPIEVRNQIIGAARAVGQLDKLGAYFFDLSGLASMTVPKEEQNTTSHDGIIIPPQPTGEGQPFVLRTPKWKAQSFAPKKLMVGIGVTNEMFREGGTFLVDYVRRMAAVDFSNQLEYNVLNGYGVEGQTPKGLLNYTGLTNSQALMPAMGNDGRKLAFSDLICMDQSIINANRATPGSNLGFYIESSLLLGLRTQFAQLTESGTVLNSLPITPLQFMSIDAVEKYIAHKMGYSTLIPKYTLGASTLKASKVIYGDWNFAWIPMWGPMEMLMSNVATVGETNAFSQDMTFVRFVQMYDFAVMAENAFTVAQGFIP